MAGIRIPARMPMIPITVSSSIKVKPRDAKTDGDGDKIRRKAVCEGSKTMGAFTRVGVGVGKSTDCLRDSCLPFGVRNDQNRK